MWTGPKRVALVQAGLAPLFAIIGFAVAGVEAGLAAFYGVTTGWAASVLMVWRERTAIRHPEWNGRRLLGVFVRTGLERLMVVTIMLGLGLWGLKLLPLPLLLGFGLAKTAWLLVALPCPKTQ